MAYGARDYDAGGRGDCPDGCADCHDRPGGGAVGMVAADGWTYAGPDYPRVEDHGDGTRTLWWNALQPVRGPAVQVEPLGCSDVAVQLGEADVRPGVFPGMIYGCLPGHLEHGRARYLWTPNDHGGLQWYLPEGGPMHRPEGVVLTADGWEQYVSEGLLPAEWAPTSPGPDVPGPDDHRGFVAFDPLTGEPAARYDRRGGWEDGEWFRLDRVTENGVDFDAWVPIPASERPFQGGPPGWAWIGGTLVQCQGESWPDGTVFTCGTGPYMGRTPADPYYPFLDPSSTWYGWPVLQLPPEPDPDAWVPDPCPEGYVRDPEDMLADCVPDPNAPQLPDECPEGWELTAEGNCIRVTPSDPSDPGAPGEPEPIPCVDVSTGIEGTMDPATGECIPHGNGPGNGNGAPGDGSLPMDRKIGLAIAAAAIGLLAIPAMRREREE